VSAAHGVGTGKDAPGQLAAAGWPGSSRPRRVEAGAVMAGPGQLAAAAIGAGLVTAGPGQLADTALGAAAATAGPGQLAAAALGASKNSTFSVRRIRRFR
jgi:hypothetical protein